ncbi:MAG: hypothetical protein K9N00_02095 [Candidatus Marinimicrobia bacterium]|nr:hypothetical protein [Candidatus Neomarinimicrobiota bacterium]
MKKYVILLIIYFYSCDINVTPTGNNTQNDNFAIYFLSDTTLTINDIKEIPLNKLKLQKKPWLSEDDIEYYDWSSHCIYLKKSKTLYFPNLIDNFEIPYYLNNKPYIITANNEAIYKGYMISNLYFNSHPPLFPLISETEVCLYPNDIFTTDWPFIFQEDIRNNNKVKNALIESNKFHSGVRVEIDTNYGIELIEKNDTTTIKYQIVIINTDKDNLYIFDPAKAGNLIFNSFNNGPCFKNLDNNILYSANFKSHYVPDSSEYKLDLWYTLVKSGDSIKREIEIDGYPKMPSGDYIFRGSYSTPFMYLDKTKRIKSNGRIWIGSTRTRVWGVVIDENNDYLEAKIFN